MTTIAYKAGLLACDSSHTHDDAVDTLGTKIKRLSSGALLGSAGDNDSRFFERLLDKIKTPAHLPTFEDLLKVRQCYTGLLIFPSGRIFKIATTEIAEAHWDKDLEEDLGVWEVTGFTAIGSGKEFAIGAMEAGRTAKEAVGIACRRDIYSNLPVHTLPLKPVGQRRRRRSHR